MGRRSATPELGAKAGVVVTFVVNPEQTEDDSAVIRMFQALTGIELPEGTKK